MTLSVKSRIGIAMTLVVLVNMVAGGFSWLLHQRAADYELASRHATARSEWVATVSEKVTAFASEATDLAFGVAKGESAESSAEYGDLVGADAAASRLIDRAPGDLDPDMAASIADHWVALRPAVFAWVNAEAQQGGSTLRLTLGDAGEVRASTSSNIEVPIALTGLDAPMMRRAVRSQVESLNGGQLRAALGDATNDAAAAGGAASRARETAVTVTVAAIALSMVVALLAAFWLYRTIAGPLGAAKAVARQVASGDYSACFARTKNDEIGALVHAVEDMRDTVIGHVNVMRELAGAVIITASDVSAGVSAVQELTPSASEEMSDVLNAVEQHSETLSSLAQQMLKV
ncbi:MAG: HAMP domain-containing protein [Coriobacteriia bacterium]